jgi:hypothetical protein
MWRCSKYAGKRNYRYVEMFPNMPVRETPDMWRCFRHEGKRNCRYVDMFQICW